MNEDTAASLIIQILSPTTVGSQTITTGKVLTPEDVVDLLEIVCELLETLSRGKVKRIGPIIGQFKLPGIE